MKIQCEVRAIEKIEHGSKKFKTTIASITEGYYASGVFFIYTPDIPYSIGEILSIEIDKNYGT
jgi:hypothetical protein